MEERDRIRYETLFYSQKLENGYLSGNAARALFIRSKLPLLDLAQVWKLSDITGDNKLDVFEFSVAMYFIELRLMGGEIPEQGHIQNVDTCKEVSVRKISVKERRQVKDIFELADTKSQGFLEMNTVKPMLLIADLPHLSLIRIWNIADLDRDGKLCLLEFTIAMHLLKNSIEGVNLNNPVNPFACFADDDDAVRLYKEKLIIFDKEFLQGQAQNNCEHELIFDMMDPAECVDFELLTDYLFDGKCFAINGQRSSAFIDENQNQKDKLVLSGSRDCDDFAKSLIDGSEAIERSDINKNINLENVFDTFSKEDIDDCEMAPNFIAKPGYIETPEDQSDEEVPEGLLYFQRRRYLGKDLVFEDPLGSEIIGDVEFEIDWDGIISDIEKETVDEERKLPIARVLRINNSMPDEQPFERTVTTKDNKEIDLTVIDIKTGTCKDEPDLNVNLNDTKIDLDTKQSQESRTELFTVDSSTEVNMRKKAGANDNRVYDNDAVDDIVEQKRLLLQTQQKERAKVFENRERSDNIKGKHLGLLSSAPVVENNHSENLREPVSSGKEIAYSEKRNVQAQENNANRFSEKQRTDNVVEEDDVFSGTSESKNLSNRKVKKGIQDSSFAQSSRNGTGNKSNNEDEEERLAREAEVKERALLERIKYLERKKQQLYERKLRELNDAGQREEKNTNKIEEKMNEVNKISKQLAEQNIPDVWSGHDKQSQKNEDERKRLAEALALKRKTEAELEKQREEALRAAEKRKLEEEAKKVEEEKEARERKRVFQENLERLKQRVLTDEKSKVCNNLPERDSSSHITSTKRENSSFDSAYKSHSLAGHTTRNTAQPGMKMSNYDARSSVTKHDDSVFENEEERVHADDMRQENFKSNRELFMKKIQSEEKTQIQEKKRNVRPKSFYGGMFNKPVHHIIDDSLLTQSRDSSSLAGDLVDQEAMKQFEREQELKKEQEKVNKLRHSLERDTSYTVENVEQLFMEDDSENKKAPNASWENVEKQEMKASCHSNRRSLVNTVTTEWNSFLDVLEENKRRESETVKMRQELSAEDEKTTTGSEAKFEAETLTNSTKREEHGDRKFDSKSVIKENAPKRKTDLANAWANIISKQEKTD